MLRYFHAMKKGNGKEKVLGFDGRVPNNISTQLVYIYDE